MFDRVRLLRVTSMLRDSATRAWREGLRRGRLVLCIL